jgi:hypothetical protein
MRIPRHGEKAIVALGFAFALLLDPKNAGEAAGQDDAREGRGYLFAGSGLRVPYTWPFSRLGCSNHLVS